MVNVFIPVVWIFYTVSEELVWGICGILLVFHYFVGDMGQRRGDQYLVVGGHCPLIGSWTQSHCQTGWSESAWR